MDIKTAWSIWPDTNRARLQGVADNGPDRFDINDKNRTGAEILQAARILLDITGIHGTKTYPEAQPHQFK